MKPAEARTRHGLTWIGLPAHPGILLFFVSLALSHHLLEIVQSPVHKDLGAESVEAVLLGALAAALVVALTRVFHPQRRNDVLSRLSLTLLPGIVFVFAPFRYVQVCRGTGVCNFPGDHFYVLGLILCLVVGIFIWRDGLENRMREWAAIVVNRLLRLNLFLLAWLLCTALLVWRGHERLAHPELFAEGGRHFVAGALSQGWESLTQSYAGYYHTLPRLIAVLATSLTPTTHIPLFTVSSGFLVAAAASAFIARPAFRWIIPSDAFRFITALLLCLVPGLREMLGTLPGLHYFLVVVLGLLLFKHPDQPFRSWELGLALLTVLSSGITVILAPVAAARVWFVLARNNRESLTARIRNHAREVILVLIIALPALFMGIATLGGGETGSHLDAPLEQLSPTIIVEAASTMFTSTFLLHPFSGTVATTEIMYTIPQPALALIAIAVFGFLFRSFAASQCWRQSIIIFAWLASSFVLLLLIAVVRDPDLSMFLLDDHWSWFKWWMRYHYLFAVFGILLWLLLLRPTAFLPERRWGNILALTLCVAYISQANWYFDIREFGKERRWDQTSSRLDRSIQTGCPRSVTIRTYPDNWKFTYHSTKENTSCTAPAQ